MWRSFERFGKTLCKYRSMITSLITICHTIQTMQSALCRIRMLYMRRLREDTRCVRKRRASLILRDTQSCSKLQHSISQRLPHFWVDAWLARLAHFTALSLHLGFRLNTVHLKIVMLTALRWRDTL